MPQRRAWVTSAQEYIAYHDEEWYYALPGVS